MSTIYWVCFLVGGSFVLLSALGGLDWIDLDFDGEADFDDLELVDPGDNPQRSTNWTSLSQPRKGLFPILGTLKSLKFWTFGSCFFGLTGIVLSLLPTPLPPAMITLIAAGMGILCGTLVAGILQTLRQRQVDSLVRSTDLIGLPGTVEIPFAPTSRGKVRLRVKGTTVDFVAFTDDPQGFNQGDAVLVVSSENNRLWVVSTDEMRNSMKS